MGTSHFTRLETAPAELKDKSPTALSTGEALATAYARFFDLTNFFPTPKNQPPQPIQEAAVFSLKRRPPLLLKYAEESCIAGGHGYCIRCGCAARRNIA